MELKEGQFSFSEHQPEVCVCNSSVHKVTKENHQCSPHNSSICSPRRGFQTAHSPSECHRALPGSRSWSAARRRGSGAMGQCFRVTYTGPTMRGHQGNSYRKKKIVRKKTVSTHKGGLSLLGGCHCCDVAEVLFTSARISIVTLVLLI